MANLKALSFAQQRTLNEIAARADALGQTWASTEGLDPRPLKLLEKWHLIERLVNADGSRGARLTQRGEQHLPDYVPNPAPLDGTSPFDALPDDLLAEALAPGNGERKVMMGPYPKPKVKPMTDDRAPLPEPRAPVVTGGEDVTQIIAEINTRAAEFEEVEEAFNPVRQRIDWDKPNVIMSEIDAPTMKILIDLAQGHQQIEAEEAADCSDCSDCLTARVLGRLRAINPRLGDLIDTLELEERLLDELKL